MSLIHPGASINFDGTDLQRTEEEEIQQEDRKQQQELHDLLSAELPEDLLNDSSNGSLTSPPRHGSDLQSYSASTSQASSNAVSWPSGSNDESNHLHHNISSSGDASTFFSNQNARIRHLKNGYGNGYLVNSSNQVYTDAEKWQMQQRYQQSHAVHQTPTRDSGGDKFQGYRDNRVSYSDTQPEMYGFAERREAEGSEDFDSYIHDGDHHRANKVPTGFPQYSPASQQSTMPSKNVRFEAFSAPTSPYDHGYHVQYKQPNSSEYRNPVEKTQSPKSNSIKADDSVGSDYVDASDRNLAEEAGEAREMTQLRILYEARGKRIEKLNREIESLKQESDREKRIMSHQLAMVEDQLTGMKGSLEESQRLLLEKDRKMNEEEGRANALKIEVDSLKSSKAELLKRIEVGERTIENLQQEVTLLQRSDALERARQQHDDVIARMNEQHESHLLEVTTMLDQVRRVADEKTEEVDLLRERLKNALKETEEVLFEKSETINKLSRNLEDAHNQCQSLLAGSGECAFLQKQVSDLTKKKSELDEKTQILENTVAELQKNVSMYENAFRLGATPRPLTPDPLSDSYSELMGIKRNSDRKSAKLPSSIKSSPDSLVESLRHELERALTSNKEKREKVSELQKQVEELTDESRHWRERIDEVKAQHQVVKVRTSNPHAGDLEDELQKALQRAHEAEERATRLEETCQDLKQQMCEIVEQHDANKQDAVDRCERACMLLHEDAKQSIREELLAEHEQKVYELSIEHDGNVQNLKNSMDALNSELSEVKQSYVHICSEKDALEEKYQHEIETEKKALLLNFEKEKKELKTELEEKMDILKKEFETEWEKKSEELLATKIALAEVGWMEEHASAREQALRDLAKKKEDEFSRRIETLRNDLKVESEKEMTRVLEQEKIQWQAEKEKEIESRINELYEELNEEKKTAVNAATSIAQLNWITEQRSSAEAEIERRLKDAEKIWKEKYEKITEQKVNETVKKMQNKIEVLNDERDVLVSQEVMRAEREWKRKRDESLRRKDEEMQKQLRKIEEEQQKEYEKFTKQHKKSLESFLQNERSKTSIHEKQNDVMDEMQKQWAIERDHLVHGHQSELKRIQTLHEARCQDYRSEIQRLTSSYDSVVNKLSMNGGSEKSNHESEKNHKEEMDKLKCRMKDEYRRWKKEREELRSKLEEARNSQQSVQCEPLDPKAFIELREIYITTLGTIKGEMLDFIRDSRMRSLNALKREAGREKERIVGKLRSRSRQRNEDAVLPSYLTERQNFDGGRPPLPLRVHGSTKPGNYQNASPSTKQVLISKRSKENIKK